MDYPHYSIKAVSRRTGLSPHVIRIWEKRYGAVAPSRSGTNRRLYSEEEIERLSLLGEATSFGHSIGNIAQLKTEKLRILLQQCLEEGRKHGSTAPNGSVSHHLQVQARALESIRHFDAPGLEEVLTKGLLVFGFRGLLGKLVAPLTQTLGEFWRQGALTAAHEHFASALIRVFVGKHCKAFALPESAPSLVVATPAGQLHELGAVLVGAAASTLGWRLIYLGTNLPASEIAGVATQHNARAVALSIVYPEDDPGLSEELRNLRRLLAPQTSILVGGRAAPAYRATIDQIGALSADDLADLDRVLEGLRIKQPV